jgi:hypothetical protein
MAWLNGCHERINALSLKSEGDSYQATSMLDESDRDRMAIKTG